MSLGLMIQSLGVRLLAMLALLGASLGAQASSIEALLPGAKLRGEATFRYLGFPLYDARLYTPGGEKVDWDQDFALKLTYKRSLSGKNLVDATMREMKRTGRVPAIRNQLDRCFGNVRPGDSYLAVTDGPDRIEFQLNGASACTLSHEDVSYRFMAIFVGEETRSASFTRALRGE